MVLGAFNNIVIFLFANALAVNSSKLENESKISVPQWVSLGNEGHKYLFSDEAVDWNSAREMCQLLGGYLVQIQSRHENNCLLAYGQNNLSPVVWWTSGKIKAFK